MLRCGTKGANIFIVPLVKYGILINETKPGNFQVTHDRIFCDGMGLLNRLLNVGLPLH